MRAEVNLQSMSYRRTREEKGCLMGRIRMILPPAAVIAPAIPGACTIDMDHAGLRFLQMVPDGTAPNPDFGQVWLSRLTGVAWLDITRGDKARPF
jgi:hypothetical protein